jgi:hypothetical protein
MGELSPEEIKKILNALAERGANAPCPRCGNPGFGIVPGYFTNFVQAEQGTAVFGGKNLPTVAAVCTKCGWVAHHALGALGLMQANEVTAEAPKKAGGGK